MISEEVWEHAKQHDQELRAVVAREREKDPEGHLGVMSPGGWSSPKTLLKWEGDAIAALVGFAYRMIREATEQEVETLSGWAIALPADESIGPHDHHQADVVLIYYLEPGVSAPLEFVDRDIQLEPRAGLAVLFRGDVVHRVQAKPDSVGKDRLAFVFNATLRDM